MLPTVAGSKNFLGQLGEFKLCCIVLKASFYLRLYHLVWLRFTTQRRRVSKSLSLDMNANSPGEKDMKTLGFPCLPLRCRRL